MNFIFIILCYFICMFYLCYWLLGGLQIVSFAALITECSLESEADMKKKKTLSVVF